MIQSKAIDILKSLNRKEFNQLGKHLEYSAFTANKNLSKLYNYLKRHYPSFTAEKLTKENLYKSVYGNTAYNDAKTRKLLSDIYKETEKFIVILNALSQKETYGKIILEEFEVRRLDTLFISKYEEFGAYLDGGEKHYQYYLEKFLVEWRNIIFHLERGMQHKIAMNIYERSEYLIFFFLSDLFLTLGDLESIKQAHNIDRSVDLAGEFISNLNDKKLFDYIEKNDFNNKNLLYSFYLGYLALKNFDDESHYYKLKEFAHKNIDKFHEGSQKTTVISLINYCNRKLRILNNEKFRLELHENYKLYMKYKLYKISGENYIRSDFFINILSNYFSVGKVTEAAKFLEDNIESIHPNHKKNMLSISNALIQFEKGNFGGSLKNVSLIKANAFLYRSIVKILSLKNNFELKNYEIAKELSNNYRIYLTENKNVSDLQKEKGLKFLHYYNILWKIYDGKAPKSAINELKKEITANSAFPESAWIVTKLDELAK